MKKLPPSWTKYSNPQLSFASALFDKPTEEDIFFENFRNHMRNAKFFLFRLDRSNLPRKEKVGAYPYWSDTLELGVQILFTLTKKTNKYKHITEDELLHDIFINKIDWTVAEPLNRSELLHHHDNVSAAIIGMLLANKNVLRGLTREKKLIFSNLEASKNILHRLD